jgi:hypothetical protein
MAAGLDRRERGHRRAFRIAGGLDDDVDGQAVEVGGIADQRDQPAFERGLGLGGAMAGDDFALGQAAGESRLAGAADVEVADDARFDMRGAPAWPMKLAPNSPAPTRAAEITRSGALGFTANRFSMFTGVAFVRAGQGGGCQTGKPSMA